MASPDISREIQESNDSQFQTFPSSGPIFDLQDSRLNDVSRDERIRLYYARELAVGNLDALAPRYRVSEDGSEQEMWRDALVADPMNDSRVAEIASVLKASGFTAEPDSGREF